MDRRKFIQRVSSLSVLSPSLLINKNLLSGQSQQSHGTNTSDNLEITTGPYLQRADETTMTVMWITNKKCLSWVEVGTDKTLLEKVINSRNGLLDLNNTIHKIRLQNLLPGQHYFYRVVSKDIIDFSADNISFGQEISSNIFEFETLDRRKQEFSFVVLNDIHQNMDLLNPLLERAQTEDFDLLFYNGDMADYFYSQEQICHDVLDPSVTHFASRIPFVWVRGNHECQGSYARKIIDYMDTWNQQYYYSFDHGPAHFLVLDTAEARQDFEQKNGAIGRFEPYRTDETEWLQQVIRTDKFKNAKFRIALCHIPFYYSGDTGPEIEGKFGPLLNDGKIDLLICGHTHNFRYYLPKAGKHDFPILVAGGAPASSCTMIRVTVKNSQLVVETTNFEGRLLQKVVIPARV